MWNDRLVLPAVDVGDIKRSFVSRAGLKLEAGLMAFGVEVAGKTCADLGANVGGFTDCLLQRGAKRVYAVDTGYGVLAWNLRKDERVVVKERVNALHVKLAEKMEVVVVDVGWTMQGKILPVVKGIIVEGAEVLTLVKPHYESVEAKVQRGVLTGEQSVEVLRRVINEIEMGGWEIKGVVKSPIEGQKGNAEYVAWLRSGS